MGNLFYFIFSKNLGVKSVHKYEKLWLKVGISSLVIFLTILMITGLHNGHTPAASGRDYVNPDKVDQIEPFNKPGLHKVSGKDYDYELVILASAFNYQPGKVEIPKGSKVKSLRQVKILCMDLVYQERTST